MADQSFLRGTNLQAPSSEFVTNNTASTLSKFKVVALNGIGEVYPQVVICNINTSSPFGILQGNILSGQSGYVYRVGFIPDIDTSAWAVNTLLYCDNAGNITNVENKSCIGYVVKQDASGVIYANPTDLNNVINTLTTNRALISNSLGQVAVSTVTSTTLSYLDATSSVQTQIDTKIDNEQSIINALIFG